MTLRTHPYGCGRKVIFVAADLDRVKMQIESLILCHKNTRYSLEYRVFCCIIRYFACKQLEFCIRGGKFSLIGAHFEYTSA